MLARYFAAPKSLPRLQTGLSAPYFDGFADFLESKGHSKASLILLKSKI